MTQADVVVRLRVNGEERECAVEPRLLLSDFLRHQLGLTGTHVGCEHGVCGACTVLVNGDAVRSCLMFAAQADGADVRTVESLTEDGPLSPIQDAFRDQHGLQCGFCTPGILMSFAALGDQPGSSPATQVDEVPGGAPLPLHRATATSCWRPDRRCSDQEEAESPRDRHLPTPLHRRSHCPRRGRASSPRGRTLRRRHRPAGAARSRLPSQPARQRTHRVDDTVERERAAPGVRARPYRPRPRGTERAAAGVRARPEHDAHHARSCRSRRSASAT